MDTQFQRQLTPEEQAADDAFRAEMRERPNRVDEARVVPLINRDPRRYTLSYVKRPDDDPRLSDAERKAKPVEVMETVLVHLHEGMNYITVGDARGSGLSTRVDDPIVRSALFQGRVALQDPLALPEYNAVEVAAKTTSKFALETWLAVETRKLVREAILLRMPKAKAV